MLARPLFGLAPPSASASPCSANTSAKNARTAWPKMIGSETFIIVAFRCSEKRTPLRLGVVDLLRQERVERAPAHHGAVDDLARLHRHGLLEHGDGAVLGDVLDPQLVVGPASVTDCSVERKSPSPIVATWVLRVLRPVAHRVRVLAHVLLDRGGRAAVGVALAQDRVDRAALDPVVGLAARRRSRIVRVVGARAVPAAP